MMPRLWGKQTCIIETAHNKRDQWFKGENTVYQNEFGEVVPTLWTLVRYLCGSYLAN